MELGQKRNIIEKCIKTDKREIKSLEKITIASATEQLKLVAARKSLASFEKTLKLIEEMELNEIFFDSLTEACTYIENKLIEVK